MNKKIMTICLASILMLRGQVFASTENEAKFPPFEVYKTSQNVGSKEWLSSYSAVIEEHRQAGERGYELCVERAKKSILVHCGKYLYTRVEPASTASFNNGKPTEVIQRVRAYREDYYNGKLTDSWVTEEQVGTSFMVYMRMYCPDGSSLIRKEISADNYDVYCRRAVACPAPYVVNSSRQCELHCESRGGATGARQCAPPPKQEHCAASTDNPIRLSLGNKIRNEHVITTHGTSPINLEFRYNNQNNNEQTFAGRIAHPSVDSVVIDTRPGLTLDRYYSQYNDKGLEHSSISAQQYLGGVVRYWRHNFDEQVLNYNGHYIYHAADGQTHEFSAPGALRTLAGSSFELTQDGGFKITDAKAGRVKFFDSSGKLTSVRDGNTELKLEYEAGNLVKVSNERGQWLRFDYSAEEANSSIYSLREREPRKYITKVSSNDGRSVDIEWGHSHFGRADAYRLITRITDPYIDDPSTAREYGYLDPRWPASLTQIYMVTDMEKQLRRPYLQVEYDEQGRAVYSGAAAQGGSDSVEYVNENTRVVTNALGKKAVYEFADVSGARRLNRITGEPTQNCVKSEVEYIYDTAGNVVQKVENGSTTQYAYDSQNREISRTEAAGTVDARTIATEYHPTLNKPVKITEPGKVTTMTYDAEGRLLSNTTQSTVAP